jgi:phosphoglycerol transferase MdoB-like AlkP superfamily enzyme
VERRPTAFKQIQFLPPLFFITLLLLLLYIFVNLGVGIFSKCFFIKITYSVPTSITLLNPILYPVKNEETPGKRVPRMRT